MSVQANREHKPLSAYFTDPYLRRAFERAERDAPPEALTVEPERAPTLRGGALARRDLVEA